MKDDKRFYIGVKALIRDKEGRILVLRKVPRKASHKWKPFWDLPGGKIQDGSIKGTLVREVYEEIGVRRVRVGELVEATVANFKISDAHGLMFLVYRCSIPKSSRLKLSKEHSEFKWILPKDAPVHLAYMLPKDSLKKIADI